MCVLLFLNQYCTMTDKRSLNVGILLFNEVELLDFAGPMQVFSSAQYVDEGLIDEIFTVGMDKEICVSKTNMRINIDKSISEIEDLDVLVIPGGFGTRPLVKNETLLAKLNDLIGKTEIILSVCTGSLLLAKIGKLSGLTATTHYAAIDLMHKLDSSINIDRSKRYHDNGKFVISEGVSAGIDASFYLLGRLFGAEVSDQVRKYIEYYPNKDS